MILKEQFGEEWYEALLPIIKSKYFVSLGKELKKKNKFDTRIIYPEAENIFRAFRMCPPDKLKVVILGQDPYHDGSATGLAFSNTNLLHISPSLRNILKEIENDMYDSLKIDQDPDLTRWAEQGVLLLNTALTVKKSAPGSHSELWKPFTEFVIKTLSEKVPAVVYLLWGAHAKSYVPLIDKRCNFILTSAHPSPFSFHKGFSGNKHFSKTNEILKEVGKSLDKENYEIKW